jgi:arylsulfatase A-like enzyme
VIILVPDTVRADHLSVNGYERPTTPALERLALEGVNFTHAITAAPRTWQSFSSILTGLYPPRHGVRFIHDDPITEQTPTFGSYFGQHGYVTTAYDYMPFLSGMTGGKGFGDYVLPDADTRVKTERHKDRYLLRVVGLTADDREAPFLAFVRLSGAHWPYTQGGQFAHEFDPCAGDCDHSFNDGHYGVRWTGGDDIVELADPDAWQNMIWPEHVAEDVRRHLVAHYDAEIRAQDERIGRLVDRLRESGLLERTILVVTSDHGESFGAHGYMQHGPRVDESVMRVPLLIRLPKRHPDHVAGLRIDSLVRVVDIFPTVLDAAGLPMPPNLDGVSLLPLLRGEELPELWAYGESGRAFLGIDPDRHLPGVEGKHRMIRTRDHKLIIVPTREGEQRRLYDLAADPGEQRDLAESDAATVTRLREHLREATAGEQAGDRTKELTSEELETLRKLGYAN